MSPTDDTKPMLEAEARRVLRAKIPWVREIYAQFEPFTRNRTAIVWCHGASGMRVGGKGRTLRAAVNAACRAWDRARKHPAAERR